MRTLLVLLASMPLLAQSAGQFQKEYIGELAGAAARVVALAKAIPAEKYSWRPGEGVRSVSEVFVHIAAGNRMLIEIAAGASQENVMASIKKNRQLERSATDKDQVVKMLADSLDETRKAFTAASAADLDKPVKFFGQDTTVRGIYLRVLAHVNEHLGQAIAYARVNGIAPPWTQPQK